MVKKGVIIFILCYVPCYAAQNPEGLQESVQFMRDSPSGIGELIAGYAEPDPLKIPCAGSDITTLAFNPAGTLLARVFDHGAIHLLNPVTGQVEREIITVINGKACGQAHPVVFDPSGTLLASGFRKAIGLFNLESGTWLRKIAVTPTIKTLAFNPRSSMLASGAGDGFVRLWNPATGKQIKKINMDSPIGAVAFNADGTLIAAGSKEGIIKVFDLKTGALRKTLFLGRNKLGGENSVTSLAFDPRRAVCASGSYDGMVRLFDVRTGAVLQTLPSPKHVMSVAFNANGSMLASGSTDRRVRIWQPETGDLIKTFTAGGSVRSVVFNPSGMTIASGSSNCLELFSLVSIGELLNQTHADQVRDRLLALLAIEGDSEQEQALMQERMKLARQHPEEYQRALTLYNDTHIKEAIIRLLKEGDSPENAAQLQKWRVSNPEEYASALAEYGRESRPSR